MAPFLLAIFLSAFLLFQLQPIIARLILPFYGGAPALWTACMMFFQIALVCGYSYAHLLAQHVTARRQPVLHLSLLTLSLLLLPVGLPDSWEPAANGQPALEILALLSAAVGIPFVLMSASAPLLQHWFAGVFRSRSPFRLYALSNFGSLAALISYPVLFEPLLTIDAQAVTWSFLYVLLALICVLCGIAFGRSGSIRPIIAQNTSTPQQPVSIYDRILWVSLAACGSTLLLAMTNQISQDVAVVPFLWILPLSLYLVSFIICFDKDAWYKRIIWYGLFFITLIPVLKLMFQEFTDATVPIAFQVGAYCLSLFAGCMVCHGELARRRSAVPHLTTYYLHVAFGGAAGGVFVNLIAPVLFTGYWELHIALTGTVLLAGICFGMDRKPAWTAQRRMAFASAWSVLIAVLVALLVMQVRSGREESILISRNFFGVMHVDESAAGRPDHQRKLYHGTIQHGRQFMHPDKQRWATSYYGTDTGVAAAILRHPKRFARNPEDRGLNIGIVGLGVGTLSTFGMPEDFYRYYEINPQVAAIARSEFVYLSNSKAPTEVILGDARVSMQREYNNTGSNEFDVLVLDAFSGDSIPVHLLTEEAFDLYEKHLRNDSILAINITNKYLDLSPVIRTAARRLNKLAIRVEGKAGRWYENGNNWVLVFDNPEFLASRSLQSVQTAWAEEQYRPIRWTDDFHNLIRIIDW